MPLIDAGAFRRTAHHSGLLRFSVNEENMTLKLMLILYFFARARVDGMLLA